MANLRVVKKDIDFLLAQVISDCWTFIYINPTKQSEAAIEIMNDAIELRNSLYTRVNHPDRKSLKDSYKAVNIDLLKGVDALFVRISELTK
ncbi:MAG: hypothetical protein A2X18_04425 [Bacteroidetes bacterium GWF2_40_14]|nr:MAG: hypothetical protein A2X18_04425 [Bacteroidetes bacterium GWF2_40_14]